MAQNQRIDESDSLIWYKESVRYGLAEGTAPGVREQREQLAESGHLTGNQAENLAALDEEALEYVLELPELDGELLQDDPSQPMEKWWWHLGAIRQGAYPVEYLPPAVQALYPLGAQAA
jgi:hypothetical protein